jgi:hypothetical protein
MLTLTVSGCDLPTGWRLSEGRAEGQLHMVGWWLEARRRTAYRGRVLVGGVTGGDGGFGGATYGGNAWRRTAYRSMAILWGGGGGTHDQVVAGGAGGDWAGGALPTEVGRLEEGQRRGGGGGCLHMGQGRLTAHVKTLLTDVREHADGGGGQARTLSVLCQHPAQAAEETNPSRPPCHDCACRATACA